MLISHADRNDRRAEQIASVDGVDPFPPVIRCVSCGKGILDGSGQRDGAPRCPLCGYSPSLLDRIVSLQSDSATNSLWAQYHSSQRRRFTREVARGNRGYPQHKHLFQPLMPFLEGSVLLDLGCGMGQAVLGPQHPAFKRYRYVGIDSSLSSLKVAQQYIPSGWFVCSSVETLELAPSSIDVIVCFGILMYVNRPIDLLVKMAHALKPGGILLLHEPILRKGGAPQRRFRPEDLIAGKPLNGTELLGALQRLCSVERVHKEYSPLRTTLVRLLGDLPERSLLLTRLLIGLDQLFIRLASPLSSRFGPGSLLVFARRDVVAPRTLPHAAEPGPLPPHPDATRRVRRNLWERLLRLRNIPFLRKPVYYTLLLLGCDIPREVKIGARLRLPHGIGVVIHNNTTIGDRVTIFSGVTIGRADAYRKTHSKFEGLRIEDDVVLSTGCKILCKEGVLTVARGSVIGANAVLLNSTKPFEVWVGVPARCVGLRSLEGLPIGDFSE